MKKLVFLFAVLLMTATGNAQTGNTDVSQGASWFNTGEAGIISKTVWNDKFQTGNYTLRLDGRKVIQIWVLRVDGSNPVKPQVLFKRGYYSRRTGNWLDLKYGQAIWGYGKGPEWRRGISGYEYLVNAVALDECGNLIESARRPVSCTTSVVVQHPTPTTGCGGCNSNTNNTSTTTTTPPVTGGTWPGMTQQPPQPQNFSLPQPERRKSWLARNWWVIPVGLLAGYGGYRLITDKKPTAGHETNNDPDPAHEPNGRPAPSWGPAPGGIILRF